MEPNPIELFLHICGAIGVFAGFVTLVLGVTALRRATRSEHVSAIASALTFGRRIGFEHISVIDVIVVVSVVLVGLTGLHMARYTGDWKSGWARVAIASLALLAPFGPLVVNRRLHRIAKAAGQEQPGPVSQALAFRLNDLILTVTLRGSVGVLVGIVFLMTVKPPLLWALAVVVAALIFGVIWGVLRPAARAGRR